jgi:hypothetical protein
VKGDQLVFAVPDVIQVAGAIPGILLVETGGKRGLADVLGGGVVKMGVIVGRIVDVGQIAVGVVGVPGDAGGGGLGVCD